MNDLDARMLRRKVQRARRLLGRGSSGYSVLQGWFSVVRGARVRYAIRGLRIGIHFTPQDIAQFPRRYALHGVAVLIGAGAMVWATSLGAGRAMQSASPSEAVSQVLEAPAEDPQASLPTAVLALVPPTSTPLPKPLHYAVEPGDTLRSIAERNGVSVETLIGSNQLANPDVLRVGQELVILPVSGVLHTVRAGESLRQVASRYGVNVADIAQANAIQNPDAVAQGMELVVPGAQPLLVRAAPAPSRSAHAEGEPQLQAMAELSPLPSEGATSSPPAFQAPAPLPKPKLSTVEYEVKPGDTINSLTQLFGVDLQTILSANDIANADLITPGTKVRIPPVSGLEHEVAAGETLADIARLFEVDLGPILDFNDLTDPDMIRAGTKLIVPGAKKPKPALPPPPPSPPAPAVAAPAAAARAAPAVAVPQPAARPAPPAPVTGSGAAIVKNAMAFRGYPYVFGGTSPAGFDCSGFVWYVYKISGNPISRAMWGQLNAGPRISKEDLEPGDIVFFANTYMPGLSHNGIYVGGGQFIHASDPGTGVTVSSMNTAYWASRYVGASRP